MIAARDGARRRHSAVSRTLLATVIGLALLSTQPMLAQASDDPAALLNVELPDYDLNATRALGGLRTATASQLQALNALKTATGATAMTARWNDFGGSVDVVYDFVSPAYAGTPEQAARAFVAQNAALFGVSDASAASLKLTSAKAALGGHLLRFQQVYNGVMVDGGGIGIVLNARNQAIMASGPFFRDVAVNTTPTLSAAQAVTAAAASLGQFTVPLPVDVTNLQELGLAVVNQQVQPEVDKIPPTLWVYPTADGYRLAWKVANYSNNPFGLFEIAVDAHTGEVLARRDHVASIDVGGVTVGPAATLPGQETADIFPNSPLIDDNLKNNRTISTCTTGGREHPCGQERITLRAFDASNRTTGANGTLTGPNVIATNALASKLPFGQAALGTWHFSKDDPTALEARTNEADQYAEPAEHQDEINAFFFVNYNKEYVDYLHVAGDGGAFGGGGAFPDSYQNKGIPTLANAHIPNIYIGLNTTLCVADAGTDPNAILECKKNIPDPATDPAAVDKVLSLDNAFALQTSGIIAGVTGEQPAAAVNPTSYGHGYYFNDLALDGMVAYHEVMHSTSTPIAGLEGFEGGSLNEGQADMWAYTLANYTNIGEYVVQAKGYRDRLASKGIDPDKLAWIRSAHSTLKYGDFLRYGDGEVHWGGEIYAAAMWDVRELLNRQYPDATTYKRPDFRDGKPTRAVTVGTEIFDRDYLATMYILGTMNPDTFVKARDAFIVADQMLYPSSSAPGAPGKHRALVEQVFAAKELGISAKESSAGKTTISTRVSKFAFDQAAPAVPTSVAWAPASANSIKVAWTAVPGAVAYEVLKRKRATVGQREMDPGHVIDGDASTTGFRHVAYVAGNQAAFEDKGRIESVWAAAGLANLTDSEYVVRAIGANAGGQLGWSRLSKGKKQSQPSDGWSNPPALVAYALFVETRTGTLVAGEPTGSETGGATWGDPAFKGITWDDVLVTTQSDALELQAALSSMTAVDLDFELRTTDGTILSRSAGATAAESVSATVQPSTTYVLRVLGFANGPATYQIDAKQLLPQGSPNANTTDTVTK